MSRSVLYVRTLSDQESHELTRLLRHSPDGRVVRRAQVVALSTRGLAPQRIADLLGQSWSGVRKIIHRFNRGGLPGLADRPRPGRPRKTTDRYVTLLKEAVPQNPRDLGYPFNAWTLDRLREHLARRTRVLLSPAHLAHLMRAHGIVYRRPKHGMSHLRNPQEYNEKKAFLEFVKKGRRRPAPLSTCSTSMSVRFTSTRP